MEIDDKRRRDITAEAVRERAVREQVRGRVPSLVLGAARPGGVVEVASVGFADVEGGVEAMASLPYRIGSITKTFTAALVLSLVGDGAIGLDARVEEYLPGTPLGAVTVRTLLSHSSGLQREAPGDMWASMRGPNDQELRDAFSRAELVDRPGARWHYSNLGYAVLGQVVEHVTGRSCTSVIDERLVGPLGLSATAWARPAGAAVGCRVDPYADRVHREPVMDQAAVGVGGQLWSTVADLLVWGDALAGGVPEVVAPAVVDAMQTLQVMVDRTSWTAGWGLGLMLERRGDRVTAGHTGAMPGFVSALSFDRAKRYVQRHPRGRRRIHHGRAGRRPGRVGTRTGARALDGRPGGARGAGWRPGAVVVGGGRDGVHLAGRRPARATGVGPGVGRDPVRSARAGLLPGPGSWCTARWPARSASGWPSGWARSPSAAAPRTACRSARWSTPPAGTR